jgi:protein TonB
VEAANLVTKVTPAYPPLAKQAQVSGIVTLTVFIGADGKVQNLTVVKGDPLLVQAAIDAVKQWVYKPILLNGLPTPVITTIEVNFTLAQ